MPDEPVVQVEALSKRYRSYARPWDRIRESLGGRPRHREHRALDDVSFEIRAGEGFGLVGENGAGKSTLLKIIAGISTPTSGRVDVRGRVASILELGSAFHPELSGRQNIALNAALLGLDARQVKEKTPAIIEFSELGEFIERPVKTYSTGMAMRLGFSIATQVEPDILIIDEALSVGDGYFQKKCIDRLLHYTAAGGTLLLCSHAMYYVSAFCPRALWLRQGKVAAYGSGSDVVRQYEEFLVEKAGAIAPPDALVPGPARFRRVAVDGGPLVRHRGTLAIDLEWESDDPALEMHLAVGLNRSDEIEVCSFGTLQDGRPPFHGARSYRTRLELPELQLTKGRFSIYAFLLDGNGLHIFDRSIQREAFAVENPDYTVGMVTLPHRWETSTAEDRERPLASRLA